MWLHGERVASHRTNYVADRYISGIKVAIQKADCSNFVISFTACAEEDI